MPSENHVIGNMLPERTPTSNGHSRDRYMRESNILLPNIVWNIAHSDAQRTVSPGYWSLAKPRQQDANSTILGTPHSAKIATKITDSDHATPARGRKNITPRPH